VQFVRPCQEIFAYRKYSNVKGSNYVSEIKDESYLVAVDSGHLPPFSGRAQCLPCRMSREREGGVDCTAVFYGREFHNLEFSSDAWMSASARFSRMWSCSLSSSQPSSNC
jgi:hypothetical protein